jgi:hypothetical protein
MAGLRLGDRLILDGADHVVTAVVIGRVDRLNFRQVTMRPELGGDEVRLLQVEDLGFFEVEATDPAALDGEAVEVAGLSLERRWRAEVRTESAATGARTRFGRGRCAWYEGDGGAVAVRVTGHDEDYALLGRPLEPTRIDLRYT